MSDFEKDIEDAVTADQEAAGDVQMGEEEIIEVETGATADNGESALPFAAEVEEAEAVPARVTFLDYLKSPVIELLVGQGEEATLLTAHQTLLTQSPFFDVACAQFSENAPKRRIEMAHEDLDARIDGQRGLVRDATVPELDTTGEQLLKHARVYTLADKLGMTNLKTLAHSKIHCVNSSAKGEIAYARYVYATTPKEDVIIRKPVAAFWAQRSHVLRKDAEDEFRQMCLEFPQFGFDVLTRVLNEKSKREAEKQNGTPMSRKRQCQSQV